MNFMSILVLVFLALVIHSLFKKNEVEEELEEEVAEPYQMEYGWYHHYELDHEDERYIRMIGGAKEEPALVDCFFEDFYVHADGTFRAVLLTKTHILMPEREPDARIRVQGNGYENNYLTFTPKFKEMMIVENLSRPEFAEQIYPTSSNKTFGRVMRKQAIQEMTENLEKLSKTRLLLGETLSLKMEVIPGGIELYYGAGYTDYH